MVGEPPSDKTASAIALGRTEHSNEPERSINDPDIVTADPENVASDDPDLILTLLRQLIETVAAGTTDAHGAFREIFEK